MTSSTLPKEGFFKRAVEQSADGLLVLNEEGVVLYANPAATTLLGKEERVLVGSHVGVPAITEPVEMIVPRGDQERKMELRAVKIAIDGGIGYLANLRDVTGIRKAESALEKSEVRAELTERVAGVGTWEWDISTDKVRWSPTVYKHFDLNPDKFGNNLESVARHIHPDDRRGWRREIQRTLEDHKPYRTEIRILRSDGSVRWLLAQGDLLLDDSGQPASMHGVTIDITELKNLQTQLQQSQKMESIGKLAGGVAHDFNNMVTTVLGNADLALTRLDESNPLRENLLEIRSAAQRSANLTRQLLAFARKQTISPKVIDVNESISGILRMLEQLIGENIDLAFHSGDNIPHVRMDPGQLDQILTNLVVNARDAIEDTGCITIRTQSAELDEKYCASRPGTTPGRFLMLEVTDAGAGMDKETVARIFEPFFTTKSTGSGLGLAMIYGIVKQNGGYISVDSELGEGTSFKIYLPATGANVEEVKEEQSAAPDAQRGQEKIMVVEDEPSLLKLATIQLEGLGYTVKPFSDPKAALDWATKEDADFDVVVSDVIMPQMNGVEFCEQLIEARPGSKCILMSGYTADAIDGMGALAENVVFLEKPFTKESLSAKVREMLDQ